MIICANVEKELIVESIVSEGEYELSLAIIKGILDGHQDLEFDERVLAMIYRGVKAEYEADGETLDIEKLLQEHKD